MPVRLFSISIESSTAAAAVDAPAQEPIKIRLLIVHPPHLFIARDIGARVRASGRVGVGLRTTVCRRLGACCCWL